MWDRVLRGRQYVATTRPVVSVIMRVQATLTKPLLAVLSSRALSLTRGSAASALTSATSVNSTSSKEEQQATDVMDVITDMAIEVDDIMPADVAAKGGYGDNGGETTADDIAAVSDAVMLR